MSVQKRLLNVGCGRHRHPAWLNMDLTSDGTDVTQHDLLRGLPFAEGSFAAVYHSHVLEHLTPDDAAELLHECRRVLEVGGVLRVVVPDLECIARQYLYELETAAESGEVANLEWIRLELFDQMVRSQSGGLMGRYMKDDQLPNRDFVASRMGQEFESATACHAMTQGSKGLTRLLSKATTSLRKLREWAAEQCVLAFLGCQGLRGLREGMFRQRGEVHRWMYDRVSLSRLMTQVGFSDVRVVAPNQSRIDGFASYELDVVSGRVRKPDSLFVEGIKSRQSSCQAA